MQVKKETTKTLPSVWERMRIANSEWPDKVCIYYIYIFTIHRVDGLYISRCQTLIISWFSFFAG